LAGRALVMPARSGLTLPVGVAVEGGRLLAATAELVSRTANALVLRRSQEVDIVVLETELDVSADSADGAAVQRDGRRVVVTFADGCRAGALVQLRLA